MTPREIIESRDRNENITRFCMGAVTSVVLCAVVLSGCAIYTGRGR